MTETDELRAELAKRGVEYETTDISTYKFTRWRNNGIDAGFGDFENGEQPHLLVIGLTPVQAIDATVGRRDTSELWPEWEQVLFANVSDEVAQDNLNECVHELLEKAATVGGTCHLSVQDNLAETDGMGDVWLECDECHWQMPLEPSTPRFKFCPNCGRRCVW